MPLSENVGYTLTFGNSTTSYEDQVGFTYTDLKDLAEDISLNKKLKVSLANLQDHESDLEAGLLIVNDYIKDRYGQEFLEDLIKEQQSLEYSKTVYTTNKGKQIEITNNVRRYQLEFEDYDLFLKNDKKRVKKIKKQLLQNKKELEQEKVLLETYIINNEKVKKINNLLNKIDTAVLNVNKIIKCLNMDNVYNCFRENNQENNEIRSINKIPSSLKDILKNKTSISQIIADSNRTPIIDWKQVPLLKKVYDDIALWSPKLLNLRGDANLYPNLNGKLASGVGLHRDEYRNVVVLLRLGNFKLAFQRFRTTITNDKKIVIKEKATIFDLNSGSLTIMSDVATGCSKNSSENNVLKHMAGSLEFIKEKTKL